MSRSGRWCGPSPSTTPQSYYVASPRGAEGGAVAAEILRTADARAPGAVTTVTPARIAALPTTSELAVGDFPATVPTVASVENRPVACQSWSPASATPRDEPAALLGPARPRRCGTGVAGADGADPPSTVHLRPGSGEPVIVTGAGTFRVRERSRATTSVIRGVVRRRRSADGECAADPGPRAGAVADRFPAAGRLTLTRSAPWWRTTAGSGLNGIWTEPDAGTRVRDRRRYCRRCRAVMLLPSSRSSAYQAAVFSGSLPGHLTAFTRPQHQIAGAFGAGRLVRRPGPHLCHRDVR